MPQLRRTVTSHRSLRRHQRNPQHVAQLRLQYDVQLRHASLDAITDAITNTCRSYATDAAYLAVTDAITNDAVASATAAILDDTVANIADAISNDNVANIDDAIFNDQ